MFYIWTTANVKKFNWNHLWVKSAIIANPIYILFTFENIFHFWNWNLFFDKSFLKQARKYFLEIFASEIAVCNHTAIPIISHLSSIQCESLSRWNRNFALLFSPAVPFILFYLGLRENHPASCQLSNRDLPSFISTSRPEF